MWKNWSKAAGTLFCAAMGGPIGGAVGTAVGSAVGGLVKTGAKTLIDPENDETKEK